MVDILIYTDISSNILIDISLSNSVASFITDIPGTIGGTLYNYVLAIPNFDFLYTMNDDLYLNTLPNSIIPTPKYYPNKLLYTAYLYEFNYNVSDYSWNLYVWIISQYGSYVNYLIAILYSLIQMFNGNHFIMFILIFMNLILPTGASANNSLNLLHIFLTSIGGLIYMVLSALYNFLDYKYSKSNSGNVISFIGLVNSTGFRVSLVSVMLGHLSYNLTGVSLWLSILYSVMIHVGVITSNALWYLIYNIGLGQIVNYVLLALFTFIGLLSSSIWYLGAFLEPQTNSVLALYSLISGASELLLFDSLSWFAYYVWNSWFNNISHPMLVGLIFLITASIAGYYTILLEMSSTSYSYLYYPLLYFITFVSLSLFTTSIDLLSLSDSLPTFISIIISIIGFIFTGLFSQEWYSRLYEANTQDSTIIINWVIELILWYISFTFSTLNIWHLMMGPFQ